MKHLKRLSVMLLVLTMLAGSAGPVFADNSTRSPKKVVAMLYDDSGSMHIGENVSWFYADYALQLFTGLLNPKDDLLLTFMSDPGKVIRSNEEEPLKDFSSDRQKTVDAIREKAYAGSGDTPYSAIESLGTTLASVESDEASTQYWYVIIADGRFEKTPGDEKSEASQKELDDAISTIAGKTMPNGSKCHVLFMSIENPSDKNDDKKEPAYPTEGEYVQVHKCAGEDIVSAMNEIADKITGRRRVDAGDITVNGKELTISSPVPLLNIQVLTQNSDASVSSAKASEGDGLQISSVNMRTPEGVSGRKGGNELHGILSTVQSKGDYISAGDYTLTLDKEASIDDIVVMYEVALETRLRFTRNGKAVEDTSVLREKEHVDIEADLVILGTDEQVDLNTLPDGLLEGMSLTIEEDGTTAASETLKKGENSVKISYEIKAGETTVTAQTNLKGFEPLTAKETFTAKGPVVYGITADGNELAVRRGYIHGKKGSVDFTVTGDGKPLTAADVEALIDENSISVTKDGKKTGVKFRYEITEDGKVHVYPKTSILNNAFAFFSVPKGKYDVTVSLDESTSATGNFTVKGYPLIGIIISLIVLALILLFLYLLRKPHFPTGTLYRTQYSIDYKGNFQYDGTARQEIGFWTKFFTLTGPRRITSNGIELEVIQNNKMHVTSKWIAAHQNKKNGRDYFGTFTKPDPNLSTKTKAAIVKREYAALVNAQPVPKWPSGKNKLFDTSSAFLAIIAPQTINTYQFTRRRKGRK